VPCPCFRPLTRSERRPDFRVPLGQVWEGECCARPTEPWRPGEDHQLLHCNFGYRRGECPHFPAEIEPDAVRFARIGGETLFILEKNHRPWRTGSVRQIEPGTLLQDQFNAWNST
jgi:hypothetical protein